MCINEILMANEIVILMTNNINNIIMTNDNRNTIVMILIL